MGRQSGNDVLPVKPFGQNIIQDEQGGADTPLQDGLGQPEVILVIEDVQVVDDGLIGDSSVGEADHLIEYRECITHTAIGFLGNDIQGFRFGSNRFAGGYVGQMLYYVGNGDAGKIVDLTTRQDGRQYFMLLGRGQDKQSVMGRFLQRLEESIESCR